MAGKFDCSVPPHFLPAWVGKGLPAETGYIVTLSVLISQATLDALVADGATEGASPLYLSWDSSGTPDWLRLEYNGSIWQWGILESPGGPTITVTGDSCQTLRYSTTFVSGTTWHSKVEIDSGGGYVTADEYDWDAGADDTGTLTFVTGGFNAWLDTTPEIYEVQDVTVTDNLLNPVFSDPLTVDFSAWDTVLGDCTIVDDFVCSSAPPPPTCGYVDFHQTTDAYVTFALPSPESNVYVEVTGTMDAASLAAIWTEYGNPGSLLIRIDDPSSLGCREELWLYDNGGTGAYNSIQDFNFGANTADGPSSNVPFNLKIWMRNSTPVGQYFAFDSDVETIDNSGCGPWTEVLVGLRSPNGNAVPGAGAHWLVTAIKVGTTDGGSELLDFDATIATSLADFTVTGDVTLVECPPPTPAGARFFEGYPWRFLFTAIDVSDPDNPDVVVTTSWAQGLLTNRQVTKALGQPTTIEADVWPDHVQVNEVWTDGYPRVAQTKRIVWAFRKEGATHVADEVSPPNGPWVCRAAGILMQPEDEGDPDVPLTHFIAYDPRKWLEARPAKDNTGQLPGPNGFTTTLPIPGSTLALLYLKNTITFDGGVFLDAGPTHGGTAFYDGTIETTPDIAFTVQQGSSVADIWNQLEQAGNMDIILDPIYDPINRPGYTHQVSIYNLAGSVQHDAVFGWDRMNRCITKIQRLHDATPGNFFDIIAVHAGQGGAPVPLTGPSVGSGTINAAALAAFGSYWMIQFFPTMLSVDPTGAAVLQLAVQALQMAKQGRRTLTMEITPERGPIPLIAYDLGDRVDIRVSKVLRVAADGLQRVEAMPFQIDDNGIEHLPGLLVSPDWRGSGDS